MQSRIKNFNPVDLKDDKIILVNLPLPAKDNKLLRERHTNNKVFSVVSVAKT